MLKLCAICGEPFKAFYRDVLGNEYLMFTSVCGDCFDFMVEVDANMLRDKPDTQDYIIQHGNAFEFKNGGFLE